MCEGQGQRSRSTCQKTFSMALHNRFVIWLCGQMSLRSRSLGQGQRSHNQIISGRNNLYLCVVQIPCFHCAMNLSELKMAQMNMPDTRNKERPNAWQISLSSCMCTSTTYRMVHLQTITSHIPVTPMTVYCTGRWAHINVKLLHFVLVRDNLTMWIEQFTECHPRCTCNSNQEAHSI